MIRARFLTQLDFKIKFPYSRSNRPCIKRRIGFVRKRFVCESSPTGGSAENSNTNSNNEEYKMFLLPQDDDPDWVRDLKANAASDPELAELINQAKGDPKGIEQQLRREMDALHARLTGESRGTGEEAPPEIVFRYFDPFDVWIWVELYRPPSGGELEMIQEVVNSWFMLGRLGAFNATNMQVMYSGSGPTEDFEYDVEEAVGVLSASMHEMNAMEANGNWVRFWVDLGTTDEMALDILLNALIGFSKEHVGVRKVVLGGQNEDWPISDGSSRPEVTMNPMRGPLEFD